MNLEANLAVASPEIFMLTMGCVILVVQLYLKEHQRILSYLMSQATLVGAAIVTFMTASELPVITFNGSYINDPMAVILKIFIFLVTALVFLYSRDYLKDRNLDRGEFYVLGLFAVLGMMVIVSAYSMLTVYLGLELLSLCLYAMVALQRDSEVATEAAMKYFVLGALASGLLLFGMSLLYGVTGALNIEDIGKYMADSTDYNLVLMLGLVFIIIGLAFKLGAVPFHMWVPDVYHGAPTAVTLFIGSAPKIAAFAMLVRLLIEGLGAMHGEWQMMVTVVAVISIITGNVIAIAQTNIKRMLAYSTIAHVGFLLLGIVSGSENGYSSSMFYVIVYALMSAGGFGMVLLLSRKGHESDQIEDFKGLNARSPWFAFMMLILMLSMAGVPPFLGFWAKLSVLQAVIQIDMVAVAVIAVIFSVIGAFYYLRVVKTMYFETTEESHEIVSQSDMKVAISVNGLTILVLGIFPGSLMAMCASAFF